jgi:ABC-2 type transport system ATP-binding protein
MLIIANNVKNMNSITVTNLTKSYTIYEKQEGFLGSVKSLFLRKYYEKKAVDDVSFSIEKGELIGFIGPNGAGKTTTLKCLSGLLYPTSGQVNVLGYTPFERKHPFLKQISLVMGQKNTLWWDLPAVESFLLHKEIYQIDEKRYKKTLDELVSLLDVEDILKVQVRNLSLGQRMKCEIIAALLHSPQVLFLDEPTIGLDVVMQKKLREFIRAYNAKHGATVILTSHYMDDVKELCKRIIVINQGGILYDGSLETMIKQFAKEKYLTIQFEKPIPRNDLKSYGKIIEYRDEGLNVVLAVASPQSHTITARILERLPVNDINIEDVRLEDVIRDVFTNRRYT